VRVSDELEEAEGEVGLPDVKPMIGRWGEGEVVRISGTRLAGVPGAVRYSTSLSSLSSEGEYSNPRRLSPSLPERDEVGVVVVDIGRGMWVGDG
jgi:hypothetical protein